MLNIKPYTFNYVEEKIILCSQILCFIKQRKTTLMLSRRVHYGYRKKSGFLSFEVVVSLYRLCRRVKFGSLQCKSFLKTTKTAQARTWTAGKNSKPKRQKKCVRGKLLRNNSSVFYTDHKLIIIFCCFDINRV